MRIAVLHDDPTVSNILSQVLSSAGHSEYFFKNTKDISDSLHRAGPDMLILGGAAQDAVQAEIIERVKKQFSSAFPILLITTPSNAEGIVAALNAGADDYMIKPLRRNELTIRIQTLLHRAYPDQCRGERIEFGSYVFTTKPARLSASGQWIELTQKEFDLALFLFHHIGQPLSRATLLDAIWAQEPEIPSRTLDTHISRVRNKLQLRPEKGFELIPVYGYGYQLTNKSIG